jgi:NADPH:quinone reductase-like Zn-dependent oxidoreductase
MTLPSRGRRIVSTPQASGEVVVEIEEFDLPAPAPGQVLIRVEASPINPSDLLRMFGRLDPATARFEGPAERPRIVVPIPAGLQAAFAPNIGVPTAVGNEGAGVVVAAGEAAGTLVGRRVAARPGGMYATHQLAEAADCLALTDDLSFAEAASWHINPLTVLGMLETVREEGHPAIVQTAAASALGQMMVKACREDGIALVNIVRRPEQAELLRGIGATHVCDSSSAAFDADLAHAIEATGATVAFDAIGGGTMADRILSAMERVFLASAPKPAPYGSLKHKQVYVYGVLDPSPTQLSRTYGMSWSVGTWLEPERLARLAPERLEALRQRVLRGLKTTFATRYTRTVSLAELLQPEVIASAARHATGEKFLVEPQR